MANDNKNTMAGEKEKSGHAAMTTILAAMIFGLIVIVLFSINACGFGQFVVFAGNGLLVAGASVMAGALLGFIFGIPRSPQTAGAPEDEAEGVSQGESNVKSINRYSPNTNLEQISDWLTKIIVGVGLTKLTVLPKKLEALADFLKPGFGSVSSPQVMAIAVVLYFSIAGFLFCYLWTRLYLGSALREADIASLGKRVSKIEKQAKKDAEAQRLVQKQLNPLKDDPEISEEDLKKAITRASVSARTNIFFLAKEARAKYSKEEQENMGRKISEYEQEKMERTIPIFRALIASDKKNQYDRNHAKLGLALMEQRTPELKEAIKELSEAIKIRDKQRKEGRLFYELKRAICRILLENEGKIAPKDMDANRKSIIEDLNTAAKDKEFLKIIKTDKDIQAWLTNKDIQEWMTEHDFKL